MIHKCDLRETLQVVNSILQVKLPITFEDFVQLQNVGRFRAFQYKKLLCNHAEILFLLA